MQNSETEMSLAVRSTEPERYSEFLELQLGEFSIWSFHASRVINF